MADISRTVEIIFRSQDQSSAGIASVEGALSGIDDEAGQAEVGVDKLGNKVNELDGSPKQAAINLAAAIKALAASFVVKEFIDAGIAVEQFDRAMTLLTGTTQGAQQEFEYISDIANTLGLNILSLTGSYVNLTAATKGTALEGQATKSIFEAISVAMSSLGKTSYDTEGALLAISQIVSKGTVSMEELRQQLGERLPGAFDIAARAMGLTTAELNALVSSGGLAAAEFLPKFAEEITKTFGNVAPIDGFQQSVNRLQNTLTELAASEGGKSTIDALAVAISGITAIAVGAIGYFELLGGTIVDFFNAIKSGDLTFSTFGDKFDARLIEVATRIRETNDIFLRTAGITDELDAGLQNSANSAGDLASNLQDSDSGIIWDLTEASKDLAKAQSDASAEIAKTSLELEKIASNERIAKIEAVVAIDTAQIEADSKVAVAAFESIATSVESGNSALEKLYGLLGSDNLSKLEKLNLQDLIDKQLELNKKLQDSQIKLTDAQAAYLRARTEALRSGDSLITVNGDGLQPHLEAFMWEILEAIQVRVNEDGGALLLGI